MSASVSLSSKTNLLQSLSLSRLGVLSPETSSPGKRSTTALTNSMSLQSSNLLPGINLLNPESVKPLRIERVDQRNKSIKWLSSCSDVTENLKSDPLGGAKQGDDLLGAGGIGKKMIMTRNERRKMNQNNLEDKLLSLRIRDLERQQTNMQSHLKRERFKLLDHFLDAKADNLSYNKNKAMAAEEETSVSLLLKTLKAHEESKSYHSNLSESNNSFSNHLLPENKTLVIPAGLTSISQRPQITNNLYPKPNSHSNITERFIEQKSKYFPSYLKPRTKLRSSSSASDIEHIIDRVKKMSEYNRRICSKHKQHRLALIKAEMYHSSKDFPEIMNAAVDEQNANAEPNAQQDDENGNKAPGSGHRDRDNQTLPTISSAKTSS